MLFSWLNIFKYLFIVQNLCYFLGNFSKNEIQLAEYRYKAVFIKIYLKVRSIQFNNNLTYKISLIL